MSDHFNGNNGNGASKIAGVEGKRNGQDICCICRLKIFSSEVRFPFFIGDTKEESFKKMVRKIERNFFAIKKNTVLFEKNSGIKMGFSEVEDSAELIGKINLLGKMIKEGEVNTSIIPMIGKIFGVWFENTDNQGKHFYEEEIGKESFNQIRI